MKAVDLMGVEQLHEIWEKLPSPKKRFRYFCYSISAKKLFLSGCRHPKIVDYMLGSDLDVFLKHMSDLTPKQCREVVEQHPPSFFKLPKHRQTKSLGLMALKKNPLLFLHLPLRWRRDRLFQEIALSAEGTLLQAVPPEDRDWKLSLMAVTTTPAAVKFVPEGFLIEPEMQQALKDIQEEKK